MMLDLSGNLHKGDILAGRGNFVHGVCSAEHCNKLV